MSRLMIDIDLNVDDEFTVIGVIKTRNGCCPGRPYLLTVNRCTISHLRPHGINYSCQCSCGGWSTNGCDTPGKAIDEYEAMTARKEAVEWGLHTCPTDR